MLEITQLRRRFGSRTALDGISLRVEPGVVVGFLGPNGAGKTTTMRIVNGLLAADSGTVTWSGAAVDATARLRFGYMPEERGLYQRMRLGDQMRFFARLRGLDPSAASVATERCLGELGLLSHANDRVDTLSHGNQQRAQLAVALVHDPDLLLLDEPFSGLDPVGVDELGAVLAERSAAGTGVLFSSHQLDLVERYCENVAVIDGGRVVLEGELAELRRRHASRRYSVTVLGSLGVWTRGLLGVTLVHSDGDEVVVDLHPGVDPATLLDAARAAGTVERFERLQPRLADLFRAAVGGPAA